MPHRHLPWRPLNVEDRIGLATGTKITIIALLPSKTCQNKLAEAKNLNHSLAKPKRDNKTCGYKIANDMQKAQNIKFRPNTVTAQCPLILAGYIWLGEVNALAEKFLGAKVKKIHHAGTYSCRRQRGNNSGAWSEHAFANAWDITGFELEDGRVVSILRDWDGNKNLSRQERKARKKFLHKSRDKACRLFRVTLSPDFNAAHKDHFHLDQGPSLSCR